MKNIKLKMGTASVVITAVVLACVLMLNVIIGIIAEKHPMKIDLTQDKIYEFSAQTKDVMKNLKSPVKAYAIIPENATGEHVDYVKTYLEKYEVLSDKFTVEYVDPYERPEFMNKYLAANYNITVGSVIVECGDKVKIVTSDQFYTADYYENVLRIDMEKKVTHAIMDVTGAVRSANIYFTTGHSEMEAANLTALLQNEGYTCNTANLLTDGIPEDADIVMCIAPQVDFTEEECSRLKTYLDGGGRFVLTAHPGIDRMEKLDSYLQQWGIGLNYDSIVEADGKYATTINGIPVPAAKLCQHTITEKLIGNDATLAMPYSMSVSTRKSTNGAMATGLLQTSEKAYGKTNLYSTNPEKEDGDIQGPLYMAAIAERVENKVSSGVLVIGSSVALELPLLLTEGVYINSDFILNSLSYMSGIKVTSDIRAKKISPEVMSMTIDEANTARIILVFVLPITVLIAGLVIWLLRRYK